MSKSAFLIREDFSFERLELEGNTLKVLQSAVDGLIQPVDLSDSLTVWVNEEGLFRNDFDVNLFATAIYHQAFPTADNPLVGPAVFTGGSDDEGNTLGLSEQMIANLATWALALAK
jgi:hypothetical protein